MTTSKFDEVVGEVVQELVKVGQGGNINLGVIRRLGVALAQAKQEDETFEKEGPEVLREVEERPEPEQDHDPVLPEGGDFTPDAG